MSASVTIAVPAADYEDHDDCLAAAAVAASRERGLEGWDLEPRWDDEDDRDQILLTIPGWSATEDELGVGVVSAGGIPLR